jgi:hypothetical protein
MSDFIPNSFQTPNDYVDRFLHLLTPEEWKVLGYSIRRIFGFNKTADRISLSQYENGLKDKDGKQLDHGTGLSRPTIVRALRSLEEFGLQVEVEPNDPRKNEGACFTLQLNADKVDVAGLEARAAESRQKGRERTQAGRDKRYGRAEGADDVDGDPGKSDIPPAVNGINQQPGKSDIPHPVNGINRTRYVGLTHNNQGKHSRNPVEEGGRADAPPQPPQPPPLTDIPDPFEHPAVVEYVRVMKPDPGLSINQAELIASRVVNMEVWRRVLMIFAGNEHRGRDGKARYVGNALDRYDAEVKKLPLEQQRARAGPQQPPETAEQKQARLARVQQERGAKQGQQTQRRGVHH